jgi:hypothetical protein
MIVAEACFAALFSYEASTMESAVNANGATMFLQAPSTSPPARPVNPYAASMRKERRASRNPMPAFACSLIRRALRADIGKTNMTLFYTHHDRRYGSAGGFSIGRALTRLLTLLGNEPVRAYRPEAHYMRGPGPAWRAKHGEG